MAIWHRAVLYLAQSLGFFAFFCLPLEDEPSFCIYDVGIGDFRGLRNTALQRNMRMQRSCLRFPRRFLEDTLTRKKRRRLER